MYAQCDYCKKITDEWSWDHDTGLFFCFKCEEILKQRMPKAFKNMSKSIGEYYLIQAKEKEAE